MQRKGWGNPEWWSKPIWKLKGPAKAKILLWCMLKRKVPTWDSLRARYLVGPGRCPLCKSEEESINHLFITCEESKNIWVELSRLLNIKAHLVNESLELAWSRWWETHPEGNLRVLPLIFFWGVWIARNKSLFQDKDTPIAVTAINCAAIYSAIPAPDPKPLQSSSKNVIIQEGIPWAFFDGASQNNSAGAGLCIFINHEHSLKAFVGLGSGTNNYAELSTLRLLLCWLLHRNILSIQFFGDSLNVINWVNGIAACHNQILKITLEEIQFLKSSFNSFIISHVFRDRNEEADRLSKAGVQQAMGRWKITEIRQGQTTVLTDPPFIQQS